VPREILDYPGEPEDLGKFEANYCMSLGEIYHDNNSDVNNNDNNKKNVNFNNNNYNHDNNDYNSS